MANYEFEKNKSEKIRVTPKRFQEYDIIDIRIFAQDQEGNLVPTRKGIALNVDQIPELIKGIEWAMQQPCNESDDEPAARLLTKQEENELATRAHNILKKHGIAVHWDTAERIVLEDPSTAKYSKWQLHYILLTRRDLFRFEGSGCFKAI